jgi:hypothetical protein
VSDNVCEEVRRTLETVPVPGAVVELRAFKGVKKVSGYFDDHEALIEEAVELDRKKWAVYVTLNEIEPALLARAQNRIVEAPKATTSDNDVLRRRWLPLDFDPVRPSGISASEEERLAAEGRAKEVQEYLEELGWPQPLVADSGNGWHLLYPIDLPNDDESKKLVKEVLEALAFKFDDDQVKLDTAVHNAARIWKLYGTVARKGDPVPERPHRRSKILDVPVPQKEAAA